MIYAKINLEIFKLINLINRNIRLHITSIYIKYIYKFITPKTLYIDRNT